MKQLLKPELLVSLLLLLILGGFLQTTSLAMPMSSELMLIVSFIVLFLLFTALVWKERSRDERENLHRLQAGRFSFLVGAGILAIGISFQALRHEIDTWLVVALIAMIFSKITSRLYSELKQ